MITQAVCHRESEFGFDSIDCYEHRHQEPLHEDTQNTEGYREKHKTIEKEEVKRRKQGRKRKVETKTVIRQ